MNATPWIYELRQYTLRSGRRDELIELFEREFVESQTACGITLDGLFRDPARPDHFIWIRSFPDMESRRTALTAFYDGDVWRRHRDAANATMIDSDDVLLLCGPQRAPSGLRGPIRCAIYAFPTESALTQFEEYFVQSIAPSLAQNGISAVLTLRTERARNSFPRLPVRENEFAFVALLDGGDASHVLATDPSHVFELLPTSRSAIQFEYSGAPHDFRFLDGRLAHTQCSTA